MLRFLVLVLLLANGAYFAWSQGFLRTQGLGPLQESEPQRLAQQIQPEAVRILTPEETRHGRAGAPANTPADAPTCLQTGVLDEAHAAQVRAVATDVLPQGSWSLDPAVVRRDDHCALGRWLHGVGGELLGDQPASALLMARHQYFHEQAANMIELAQQGEWDKAVQVLNGGYRHGSSQVVLLLKELKRGLAQ